MSDKLTDALRELIEYPERKSESTFQAYMHPVDTIKAFARAVIEYREWFDHRGVSKQEIDDRLAKALGVEK